MRAPATVIELFCGCGGMSSGLAAAGYNVLLGTDFNPQSIDAFGYNHGHVGSRAVVADIRETSGERLAELAQVPRRLDVLVGGPPCQPFSIIGKRQAFDDARGDLVLEYVRVLRELQPEAFVFENVANFAKIEAGHIADKVVTEMRRAGYAVSHGVLDAQEFGVAQMRRRFFAIGVKGSVAPGLPAPTHGAMPLLGQLPLPVCRDVLDDLPDVDTEEALRFRNHEGTSHSPAMIKMFEQLRPGERDPKSHHDRLDPTRPSYTIRAGNGNFTPLRPVHYRFNRVISVRESARIQSFPDHFSWPDDMSRLQQYRQVGNAVPPLLAAAVGRHLASRLGFQLAPEQFGRPSGRTDRRSSMSVEERVAKRRGFIRGASVGRT